jgi:uroporphyrinogen decarboxylase
MVLPWCFHSVATSMGLERFALACCDDPDFVRAALAWVEERNRKAIDRAVSRVRPDLVLFDGDCAFKTGLMVNPKMFRDLTWDITEETLSHLRPLGIPYAFHSDGAVGELLPMLIELGFAAFHGCEKQANDLGGLVERFGDDLCLVGNMDVVFLAHARPEEVRRETRKMLEVGSRKGRFAAACNTSPMDYIPDENYIAMTQTIQEFARA